MAHDKFVSSGSSWEFYFQGLWKYMTANQTTWDLYIL